MLGFGEIILALLAMAIILGALLAIVLGGWKVVHTFRRQHRLEQEQDERNHRKQLADDYAESIKMLEGTAGNIDFQDYVKRESKTKVKN